jgi:endonuclease/exonuclease/phosphatase family metal-dependent hydrolase
VHLEASQTAFSARATQLSSAFKWTAQHAAGVPMLVAGDFNTGADSALLDAAVRTGSAFTHGQRLASAYEHPAAVATPPLRSRIASSGDVAAT